MGEVVLFSLKLNVFLFFDLLMTLGVVIVLFGWFFEHRFGLVRRPLCFWVRSFFWNLSKPFGITLKVLCLGFFIISLS